MLNTVEDALGYPLIERIRGGSSGGSVLTGKGRRLMDAYDGFSAEIRDRAAAVFEDYFRADAETE